MQTKNQILAQTVIEAIPQLTDENPVIAKIKKEIEDDKLISELKEINNHDTLSYNPFLVELLINESTEMLQSLMQRRSEIKTMETTLLSESVNRIMSAKKRAYDDKVTEAESAFGNSSKMLSKQAAIKIDGMVTSGEANSIQQVKLYEDAVREAKKVLRSESVNYEDILMNFSNEQNSGLNYLNRYVEMKEVYWEDFKEVFRKLKSLEVGFKTVYEIDSPLPVISKENLLNRYYLWLKNALRQLSKTIENEQEFTLVLPLQNGIYNKELTTPVFSIPSDSFTAQVLGGSIEFTIPKEVLGSKKLVRLRNIGVLVKTATELLEFWNLKITLPKQVDSKGTEFSISELLVSASNARELTLDNQVRSMDYFNANPFSDLDGGWKIKIPSKSSIGTVRNSANLKDITLYLKLAVKG